MNGEGVSHLIGPMISAVWECCFMDVKPFPSLSLFQPLFIQ